MCTHGESKIKPGLMVSKSHYFSRTDTEKNGKRKGIISTLESLPYEKSNTLKSTVVRKSTSNLRKKPRIFIFQKPLSVLLC